jgi:transketolase
MVYNPENPAFANRDRFVLSAGHGSMLLYSCLHIFGYDLPKDELMRFRQRLSATPGHPEYGRTPGVETSTGPLGQGVANAVGFAAAESLLAARFNKPGLNIVDHYTYCLAGDGCMMEGIESEAASLAGTWGLGKLIVFYDSNDISIEGDISIAFRENVGARHEAQGWHVVRVEDAHDLDAVRAAVAAAKAETGKPSLIIVKTVIGYGSPNAGTADTHGSPLGDKNLAALKKALGWTGEPFTVPDDVKYHTFDLAKRGAAAERKWKNALGKYKKEYPADYAEYAEGFGGKRPKISDGMIWECADKPEATRNTGAAVLKKLAELVPNLVGGSADLAPSNKTYLSGRGDYSKETPGGLNFHFGVREHAMAAITNGLQLHGGLNAYCSTFFVFSDYMRGAIRMSALMNIPVMYILTHDSIGVGEDGPTHQPVEHLASLRALPDLKVFRPADYRETVAAYVNAVENTQPSCLVLSRQNLPQLGSKSADVVKGGYVLSNSIFPAEIILMASGSEVHLIVAAGRILSEQYGLQVRIVSMPCMELFDAQPQKYKDAVLPKGIKCRIAVEAAAPQSWYKYVGLNGLVIGIDTFGRSAPAERLFEDFGFTAERIAAQALSKIRK